jgi:hypothetical protein
MPHPADSKTARIAAVLCLVFVAPACDREPTAAVPSGIEIKSGAEVADTVFAELFHPLTVQVREGNRPVAAGTEVVFQATSVPGAGHWPRMEAWVAPAGTRAYAPSTTVATDASGTASASVKLGTIAGDIDITVRVPALGYVAKARYTVHPGGAVAIQFSPADTAVYTGRSYSLAAGVVDRFGNLRDDPVQLSSGGQNAITLSGTIVESRQPGRARIHAVAGSLRDTAFVSVVPEGQIAAVWQRRVTGDSTALVVMDLDGSGLRRLPDWANPKPRWSPLGPTLVIENGGWPHGTPQHFVELDLDGAARGVLPEAAALIKSLAPIYDSRGEWIYFAGAPSRLFGGTLPNDYGQTEIWRVRPDGADPHRVGPTATYYDSDTDPSPSPDGRRLAYVTDRDCCGGLSLRILDVATGAVDSLGAQFYQRILAESPRWSPTDDDLIAFGTPHPTKANIYALQIFVIHADGTGRRLVTPPAAAYRPQFDWSPDGAWIIAQNFDTDRLDLIEVATGETLPLPFTARMGHPTWRRPR